jgi:hypothetical protein
MDDAGCHWVPGAQTAAQTAVEGARIHLDPMAQDLSFATTGARMAGAVGATMALQAVPMDLGAQRALCASETQRLLEMLGAVAKVEQQCPDTLRSWMRVISTAEEPPALALLHAKNVEPRHVVARRFRSTARINETKAVELPMPQEPLPAGVTLPKRPTGIYLPEFQKVIQSHDGLMQRHHKGLGPAPKPAFWTTWPLSRCCGAGGMTTVRASARAGCSTRPPRYGAHS